VCCHSFATEPSVMDNSCTTCTGHEPSNCSIAICAAGYASFSNGTCCRAQLEERALSSGEC
jgi:hypothetical protein